MRTFYDLPAPAKLNLFLHITGRRADGYHLLESAFMLIDWADTLHFELRSSGLSREDLTTPLPAQDLCLRAAAALQAATGCTQGAHISIAKSIPAEAGMGGGSSDAATTLIALNHLWGLGLSRQDLCSIGLGLGADVPFFIFGQNAWVQGIGEQMRPIDLPPARFVVCKPPTGLSTAAIFSSETLKRDTEAAIIEGFAEYPYNFGCNDLQPVATRLLGDVAQALTHLQMQGLAPRMTGSGSAVFAPLRDSMNPLELQSPPAGWQQRVCANLPKHPLFDWLA
jgi:4-diphosphocytidyl-2-C-methyl-D-erythritol kinase